MCRRKCWIVSFFLLFFCTFPIGNFLSKGRFWTTTLPHPSPNCHQSQKLEFCSYFCPKKCPSFARTFTKMSLSEGFGTLPFQTFLWTLPSDSYWLMLKMFFSFAFCTFFKIFHVRLGEKRKNVSFYRRVCMCSRKWWNVSFFLLFSQQQFEWTIIFQNIGFEPYGLISWP